MRYLALLHCFNFLVLKSFSQPDHEDCKPRYNDNTPIDHFKDIYKAKLKETEIPDAQPVIDKSLSSLKDYFLESSCGEMAVETEAAIVNGTDAPDKAWPWQTLIHADKSMCGGILISDRWVLSAAHCFFPPTKRQTVYVELGIRIMGPVRGESVFTRVAKVIVLHEGYTDADFSYDVALVKLDSRVSFSEWVRPACLPLHRTDFNDSNVCYITGFGKGAPEVDEHVTLQQLKVQLVPLEECLYFWRFAGIKIDKRSFCVEGLSNKAGACMGDSGGPLSCKDGSKYYVAGITNFVITTCFSDVEPDVYARVPEYLNWIFTNIDKYKI